MAKYYIEFTLPISTCRVIEADSEEQAKEIAEQMLYDGDRGDAYWEDIIDSMESDFENWRKKYCEIDGLGKAEDSMEADNEEA